MLKKRSAEPKAVWHFWLFATPWTVARQAPLSTGFPGQEHCSGFPFPPPGDLPNPCLQCLLHWRWVLYHWATWEALPDLFSVLNSILSTLRKFPLTSYTQHFGCFFTLPLPDKQLKPHFPTRETYQSIFLRQRQFFFSEQNSGVSG